MGQSRGADSGGLGVGEPFYKICPPPLQSPNKNKNKKNPEKQKHFDVEAVVCHIVYPLAYIDLQPNVHGKELLVWFEASVT